MANKGNVPSSEKSRFRFILVEGEVSAGELQQFAQTIAAAIKAPQPVAVYPRLPAPPAVQTGARPDPQPDLFDGVVPEEGPEAQPEVAPQPGTQKGAAKKKLRTPQLVSDLEFVSGERSLTDYMKQVDSKEHSKRYLAITFWLRHYRNVSEVSGDHIYTGYRFLGLNVPKDVGSILRALKAQEWLEPGSSPGSYKITHIGENHLAKSAE